MQNGRPARVAALIREEVAKLIAKGLKDPRIGFVSVMDVRMSPDLRYANVYVSLYGEEKQRKGSMAGLKNSAGWIRREIGKHLRMRVTPEVRFFEDNTLDQVYDLEKVFDTIHEEQEQAPMRRVTMVELAEELRQAGSLLITSHLNPDGDAVGSALGVWHFAKAIGVPAVCALHDPVPQTYRGLPGAKQVITREAERPDFDTLVIVDVASLERTGDIGKWAKPGQKVVVIDHHLDDSPDGTLGIIDASYAAVGEMVADLFAAAEIPLSVEAAHCAYVAQITDTGGYQFSNTNARSHRIAQALHETGLKTAPICEDVFGVMALPKFELLRRALARAEFRAEGRLASSFIRQADFAEVSCTREDMDGIVNYLRNVSGVVVGAMFTELDDHSCKVSLRSHEAFNSAVFLAQFGGGGHAAAAGATLETPLEEAMPMLLERLADALKDQA